jgi:hypothetical protein
MLLIFGAEVNPLNNHCQTPLDLAISRESCNTVAMLISVDGKTGNALLSEEDGRAPAIRKLEPFNPVGEILIHRRGSSCDRCGLFYILQPFLVIIVPQHCYPLHCWYSWKV